MNELDGHRISSIEELTVLSHYPRTIGRNARLGSHGAGPTSTAVALRTDQGASGWGLAIGPLDDIRSLMGRPVGDLIDPAIGVVDDAALPLDYALHDLAGVILDQPAYELLGGRGEPSTTCYDGAIYFDDLDVEAGQEIDTVLANCAMDHAAGFRAFKVKIGRGHRWMESRAGMARDIEVTRAVRAAYPDANILVDANDGFSIDDTVHFMENVADCGLFWIEEPFAENREDLTRLRAFRRESGSATLVADGEAHPDVASLLALAADGLIDVLLMDVVSYGLTAWRKIMPALREVGVQASPHAWGEPLKTLYAAQIGAGLGNVLTVEGVPGAVAGIDTSGYRFDAGRLDVPKSPGFGIPVPTDGGSSAQR
ncbi:MAG TPA: enolase C-terminal domain-like protein [Mycobacteriales bacterium]|nr:enolase C-terminal domain-like protein [Mycobacteriales bacterium]